MIDMFNIIESLIRVKSSNEVMTLLEFIEPDCFTSSQKIAIITDIFAFHEAQIAEGNGDFETITLESVETDTQYINRTVI